MNEQVEISALCEATLSQFNEVCLSLYYVENGQDVSKPIRQLLEPEVNDWTPLPKLTIDYGNGQIEQEVYQADNPPSQFHSLFLLSILPNLTSETRVVQLIINLLQKPVIGWQQAAEWLHQVLQPVFLQPDGSFLSYSVVYRATIEHEGISIPTIGPELLNTLWWIHELRKSGSRARPVAQLISESGWLWVVNYPTAPREGIVYLALGRDKQSEHLASEAFATRSSALCSLDAFTHKGIKQGLELMNNYKGYEQKTVKPLQNAVSQLLRKESGSDELAKMARRIKPYAKFCWDVERLAFSIKQQISGINRLYLVDPMPTIASHHLLRIKSYEEEAQAIVIKNKDTLEIARTALSMAEATETKRANSSQERFNLLIAFVGIFLAADQILDTDFAKELLALFHYKIQVFSISKPPLTEEQVEVIPYWAIFGSRVFSALGLSGIIFGIGWIIRRSRRLI